MSKGWKRLTDDPLRSLLGARIHSLVSAAYRAHMAGMHPPSGYCQSLTQLANTRGPWTEGQLFAYVQLMRGASVSGWNPNNRNAINWLYLAVAGHQRARWEGFSTEELERILTELEM